MRIGIDIKCLRYNNSGIGRYLKSILDALQQVDTENEYLLFSPHRINYRITNRRFKLVPYAGRISFQKRFPGIVWQQLTLPRLLKRFKIDVFWGPEQTLPLARVKVKTVLTIHDFVYKRFPETMQKTVLWINDHIGEKSIDRADVIAVNSEFTRTELLHFHPDTEKGKIEVVHCGINRSGNPERIPAGEKSGLLFVGSLEPRKNLTNLIRALEILDRKGIQIPLTLTGPKGWKNAEESSLLKNTPIARNIRHLGFVDDTQLESLYAHSVAVIFPSVYEGFGLPALEALVHWTPVLTTKGSAMEEIVQGCGAYFDAGSPESIARAIEDFFGHYAGHDFLEGKEAEREAILETYQWNNSAKKLVQIFKRLDSGEGRA